MGNATNSDGTQDQDPRRRFRVFLACSRELAEEREGFARAIERLNLLPHVRRSYIVVPVRWDTDAAGFDAGGANRAIALSVEFPRLDVVVVAVWKRVGQWTLEEYERALKLRAEQPKPELLVYIRNPPAGEDPPADVSAFRERAFKDGAVAIPYETPEDFFELLARHIRPVSPNPELVDTVSTLRPQFSRLSTMAIGVATALIAVSMFMSFPDRGVNIWTVLIVLGGPLVVLATTLVLSVLYRRILETFRAAWRSPAHADDRIWLEFLPVVPRWALPRYLRSQVPPDRNRELLSTVLLMLAFLSGPIAAYDLVFQEVMIWERAVGWHSTTQPDGSVTSNFVDRDRKRWPFGLQDAKALDALARDPGDLVYIHAQEQFCNPREQVVTQRFRCNLGPELKPLYVWLLFGAFVVSTCLACSSLAQLCRLSRTLPRSL